MLANQKNFDPDVQVSTCSNTIMSFPPFPLPLSGRWSGIYYRPVQDGSGWTPLMISASVPDSEPILRVLIQKGAEVNEKSENNPPTELALGCEEEV